eukprot:31231-Pelagococcus_subviridis.AAC.5
MPFTGFRISCDMNAMWRDLASDAASAACCTLSAFSIARGMDMSMKKMNAPSLSGRARKNTSTSIAAGADIAEEDVAGPAAGERLPPPAAAPPVEFEALRNRTSACSFSALVSRRSKTPPPAACIVVDVDPSPVSVSVSVSDVAADDSPVAGSSSLIRRAPTPSTPSSPFASPSSTCTSLACTSVIGSAFAAPFGRTCSAPFVPKTSPAKSFPSASARRKPVANSILSFH